jgi:predicted CXXCH cytochrome family protein
VEALEKYLPWGKLKKFFKKTINRNLKEYDMRTTCEKLVFAALLFFAGTATTYAQSIVGTLHDLSGSSPNTTQTCVYCHAPHAGVIGLAAPLWNRNNPAPGTFTMYDSPTIQMTIASGPQGVSLACLSCHDGVTAYNSLVNAPSDGTAITGTMSGSRALGQDLSNDHPISITYDPTADTAFNAASSVTGAGGLVLFGAGADQVECGSCHNPHDNTNGTFLRKLNTNSDICTTCHIK